MSEAEEEWKPNRRPQSTMALSLAAALDVAFMLDSEVDNLSQSVQQKRQMVTIQNRELEALEAKIREAEQLLKAKASRSSSPISNASHGRNTPRRRPGLEGAFPTDDVEKGCRPSHLSSPISESNPSDEGFTDSSASAATSTDADESANRDDSVSEKEEKGDAQGKDRNHDGSELGGPD